MSVFTPFSPFLRKKNLTKNLALSSTTLFGFLTPCQNLGRINGSISGKHLDGQMDKQSERQLDGGTTLQPNGEMHRQKDERTDGQPG